MSEYYCQYYSTRVLSPKSLSPNWWAKLKFDGRSSVWSQLGNSVLVRAGTGHPPHFVRNDVGPDLWTNPSGTSPKAGSMSLTPIKKLSFERLGPLCCLLHEWQRPRQTVHFKKQLQCLGSSVTDPQTGNLFICPLLGRSHKRFSP